MKSNRNCHSNARAARTSDLPFWLFSTLCPILGRMEILQRKLFLIERTSAADRTADSWKKDPTHDHDTK